MNEHIVQCYEGAYICYLFVGIFLYNPVKRDFLIKNLQRETEKMSSNDAMGTDKNCQTDCNLEMGISERFDGKLKEQESVRLSKPNVNVQTFEDTKIQEKFKSTLNDPLIKILDHPEDQQIFRAGLEGM